MSKSTALTITKSAGLPAKREETKAEKFRRLANARASEAIAAIERLGNLGSPQYEYTPDQVSALRKALTAAVITAIGKLEARGTTRRIKRDII